MLIKMIETLIIGFLGGELAKKIKMPAPFMTGSMLSVAVFSIFTNQMFMPGTLKTIAQIVSGAYIGQQVKKEDLFNFPKLAKSIILLMTMFTLNMFVMGFFFHYFFSIDLTTAFMSCMPGGIMDVSLMSIDMGAQAEIVATMQLIRLVGMLVILPYWISFILKRFEKKIGRQSNRVVDNEDSQSSVETNKASFNDVKILVVAGIGGLLGVYLKIPVGALVLSLIFSSILKITTSTTQLNSKVRYFAQILAGSIIGNTFNKHSLEQIGKLFIPAILLLLSYLVINVLFGYIVYKKHILDLKSALFASSPAGATDISLIAGELGGDMPKIAAIQICRTLYTIIVLPQLIRLIVNSLCLF